MSVKISLSDEEAQRLANLAEVARESEHRHIACPICELALEALAREGVEPVVGAD